MPKVSIIIPIYNMEIFLRECLNSVTSQALKELEIICVNDGSTDASLEIINEYAANDPRFVIINKENKGYGSACNTGLKKASGKYVAILEADDFIDINMYKSLYEDAEKYDVDIAKSLFYENYDTDNIKEKRIINWQENFLLPDKIFTIKEHPEFLYFHPSIWSCIYKKDFLLKHNIKFIEAPKAGWADNPFQIETMCLAEKIFYTNTPYYYWRKQNLYESDDLKDYTIPFKRSDEIHIWLNENNINDKGIVAHIHKRELCYIKIVLNMLKMKDYPSCRILIKKMLRRMKDNKIINYMSKEEKFFYMSLKMNIFLIYFGIKIRQMRQKIVRILWNKKEKSLTMFGITFFKIRVKNA